jgi:hypothetical protein
MVEEMRRENIGFRSAVDLCTTFYPFPTKSKLYIYKE